MNVVLLSSDLMVQSRVAGAAERVGAQLRSASTVEQAVGLCEEGPVRLLLVDLSTSGLKPQTLIDRLPAAGASRPTIVAFGPHVHESLLSAAREAGCDEVVSRGQFFSQLDAILQRD
jgi:CheY-like chemotaxis protein